MPYSDINFSSNAPVSPAGYRQPEKRPIRAFSDSHSPAKTDLAYVGGTATTVIEWEGFRLLTELNFPIGLDEVLPVDCLPLSHYCEDHFDRAMENSLNRAFPIITTPHAARCLASQSSKTTHSGPLSKANDFLGAVPPTNGWLVELGYLSNEADQAAERNCVLKVGYCIYIYRDTLFVDELKEIPKRLKDQQLMLILPVWDYDPGTIDVTIPIHYDDCSVFSCRSLSCTEGVTSMQ
ncbi:hypothetical protein Purlil1_12350 [Purpureocillium lilacinum]|uniref:Uncharacterized protein n=1 Tax=Purpureocillium lilacinum TaxID=33203 RepID=A0ABR0BH45_PURLI|nr:hypothetical protein Purlil1_12350 [Purpureocillium lilacinum]